MKLFHLYRIEDQTGVSGTGPVVEGVEFTNGWCAIRWISQKSTVCFYQSLADVKNIHGHGGRTELVVHDFEPARKVQSSAQMELFIQTLEEISAVMNLADDPGATEQDVKVSIENIKGLLDLMAASLNRSLRKSA